MRENRGAPSEAAFQQAFGVAPTALDGELSQYSQRSLLTFYSVQLGQRVASLKASPDLPLAHAALGVLLLRQKQSADPWRRRREPSRAVLVPRWKPST